MPKKNEYPSCGRFRIKVGPEQDAAELGSRIRRFLLSEIEGVAATAVRIEGVSHEYQAIPGVREDALELIENIKQVRVRTAADTVRASVDSTSAEVRAGDITIEEGEVVNGDLHIAHLSPGAGLKLEIVFTKGKGLRVEGDAPEGFIPVFAHFNPVVKVGVNAEDGEIEVTIETDGTIHPASALAQASAEFGLEFAEDTSSPQSTAMNTNVELGPEFNQDPFMGTPPEFRDWNRESYAEFLVAGIPRLLDMLFPLNGQTESGKGRTLDLIGHRLQMPEDTPAQCQAKGITYEGRLYLTVRVKRGSSDGIFDSSDPNWVVQREVDMGPIPLMTEDGRFIIDGSPRTCITLLDPGMKVRRVGDLIMEELQSLIERMKPVLEERVDSVAWLDADVLDLLPFSATICGLLTSSQWSQYSDETDPLALLTHRSRLSLLHNVSRSEESDLKLLHVDQFGRLDYLENPEGPNCGLIHSLCIYARINEAGEILTPYRKAENCEASGEIVYLTADEEATHMIADCTALDGNGKLREEWVTVRTEDDIRRVPAEEVDLVSVSPLQPLSYSASLIPFLGHDDPNRALMATNMQRQAVPPLHAEQPLIKTGAEAMVARSTGQIVAAKRQGRVVEATGEHIVVQCGKERDVYDLRKFVRSNQATCTNWRTIVERGETVVAGQTLADTTGTCGGEMALGRNVLAAYMPFGGYNFEDAICVSDELVADETFATVHIDHFVVEVGDAQVWIAPIGTRLNPGDVVIQEAGGRKRPLFVAPPLNPVVLIQSHRRGGHLTLYLAQKRNASVGDKFAGRHGNKGCIAKILPRAEMPHLEDGTPVQMVFNTLGVISRMNLGQILEAHYGLLAHTLNKQITIPPFMTPPHDLLKRKLAEAGLSDTGMATLYDGATGKPFDSPVTVGWVYMMKLAHMVDDKMRAIAAGKSVGATEQRWYMGQRVGSMEMWALEAYNAGSTLHEFLTIKSDDAPGRERSALAIMAGEKVQLSDEGDSLQTLQDALKGLGISIEEERR